MGIGAMALAAKAVERLDSPSFIDDRSIRLLLSKVMSGKGLKISILGDSTEAGVGNGSTNYGENHTSKAFGGQEWFAFNLMQSKLNHFVAPDKSIYSVQQPSGNPLPVPFHFLTKANNPTITYALTQPTYKTDRLTIYHNCRTTDTAATFDVTIGSTTTTIDSYQAANSFGNIEEQITKTTIDIPSGSPSFNVSIHNIVTLDRGSGVSANGSVNIVGFSFGEGIEVKNYAVASTTLLNNSTANQAKGVTTDGQFQKAYDFVADVYFIGFGTNDSKTGVSSESAFITDLKARIDAVRTQNPAAIIILNTDPKGKPSTVYDQNFKYNQAIRQVAFEKSTCLFDVEQLFGQNYGYYYDDVHPNLSGYTLIGNELTKKFQVT